jgi:hypothetical protein
MVKQVVPPATNMLQRVKYTTTTSFHIPYIIYTVDVARIILKRGS